MDLTPHIIVWTLLAGVQSLLDKDYRSGFLPDLRKGEGLMSAGLTRHGPARGKRLTSEACVITTS